MRRVSSSSSSLVPIVWAVDVHIYTSQHKQQSSPHRGYYLLLCGEIERRHSTSSRWLQHKSVCRNVIIKTTSCSEQKRRLQCGAAADESQKSLEKTLNLVPLSWRFYSPLGRLLPRALSTFNQLATTLRLHSNYSILSQCLSLSLIGHIMLSAARAVRSDCCTTQTELRKRNTREKKIFEQGAEKSGEEEKKEKLWKIN